MDNGREHTPGPWIYYNARAHQNGEPVLTVVSISNLPATVTGGQWIADVRWGHDSGLPPLLHEGNANCRLITTAPDMFEALIEIERRIFDASHEHDMDVEDFSINAGKLLELIAPVLAKAEGRPTPC